MLSLEEPADRLVARLTAAGADLDAVSVFGDVEDGDDDGHLYRRRWQLPGDCGVLEEAIRDRPGPQLLGDGPRPGRRDRQVRPAPGSNYRLPEPGLSFVIGNYDETEAGFVSGLQVSDVDAQAITSPPLADSDEEGSALDEARDFLRSYLAMGSEKADDVIRAAAKTRIASGQRRGLARW